MNPLLIFKQQAIQHNICTPFKNKWDNAGNLKDIADTAMDIQGIEFLCKSFNEGWGIDTDFASKEFELFINGNYTFQSEKGYTTQLYINHQSEVNATATNTCLINSTCIVNITTASAKSLYIAGNSEIVVFNEGFCAIYAYGNADVTVKGNGRTHIKHIK